jgi:fructose/tagatose bisphosphate aldolase
MPLVKLSQCLAALPPHGAVGCFSVYNLESLQALVTAAEAEQKPAVISLDEQALQGRGFDVLAMAALYVARAATVPLTVHLNHSRSLKGVEQALNLGLPSVMFDGSALAMSENIRLTHEAALSAHAVGAEIEGEYGPLCTRIEDLHPVLDYLEQTGIDFLAFSVPKGLSQSESVGQIILLAEIAAKSGLPLVLHDASRLPESLLSQVLCSGVRKINVHSEILRALARGLHQGISGDSAENPLAWLAAAREEIQHIVQLRIRLFSGSSPF